MEPRFQKLEDKLNSIKRLNDSFGGKQLLFYSLEDSEGSGGGDKAQGALDMSSSLLEAIVQMLNAPSAYERLPIGTVVNHPKRGRGIVEDILPDLRRAVRFEKVRTETLTLTLTLTPTLTLTRSASRARRRPSG